MYRQIAMGPALTVTGRIAAVSSGEMPLSWISSVWDSRVQSRRAGTARIGARFGLGMVRIEETRGRADRNSGYGRLFGNQELGALLSRVHATVIRAGSELEALLERAVRQDLRDDFSQVVDWITKGQPGQGTRVCFKPRKPSNGGRYGSVGDVVVFKHDTRTAIVVEIKDGDTFDTKKADGELASLTAFSTWSPTRPGTPLRTTSAAFTRQTRKRLSRASRVALLMENLRYFVSELVAIPAVGSAIRDVTSK